MPLYQEPAVYIEEQPPLVTPIPSASTSIAGFVGMTEKGPTTPQLVSSLGAFRAMYGGSLDRTVFTSGGRAHHYLPEAVTGFFANQGQACWISRVVPAAATHADFALTDTGPATGNNSTRLLFGAPVGTGDAVNPPRLYVLQQGLGVGDTVQIGSGSEAETHGVTAVTDFTVNTLGLGHVPLAAPLMRTLPAGTTIQGFTPAADTGTFGGGSGGVFDLAVDEPAGAATIQIATNDADGALIGAADTFLQIGSGAQGDQIVRAVGSVQIGPQLFEVTLGEPLTHAVTALPAGSGQVTALDVSTDFEAGATLARDAARGTTVLAIADIGADLRTSGVLVRFDDGPTTLAVARMADLGRLTLTAPTDQVYESGTTLRQVQSTGLAATVTAAASATQFDVDTVEGLVAGQPLVVGVEIGVTITAITGLTLTVAPALPAAPAVGDAVFPDIQLTADLNAGAGLAAVNCRLGLDPVGGRRQLLRIGLPGAEGFREVAELPAPRGVAPDGGNIFLAGTAAFDYPAGTPVRVMSEPVADPTAEVAQVVLTAAAGSPELIATGGASGYPAGALVLADLAAGDRYLQLAAAFVADQVPTQVELDGPLARSHPAGAPVAERDGLLRIEALSQGGAGNALRVQVQREPQGLVTQASVTAQPAADQIRLDLVTGVHPGTVLELVNPGTGAVQGPPIWVAEVDAANGNLVTLGANLDPANLPAVGLNVRSVEYRITILDTYRVPPGQPALTNPVKDSEVFRHISLSSLHPNYAPVAIGDVNADADPITGQPQGVSGFVRVEDLAPNPGATLGVRALALLTDTAPSGAILAAQHPLTGGDDLVGLMSDADYMGTVSNDPADRTGIEALRNARDCSLIACPGQTTVAVQSRLIQQAESLRDRFALLDLPEDARSIAAAQAHRGFYDSPFAAMFYHWLRVVDLSPGGVGTINVPPSGHMAGLYARTDLARGVFKAPANEVVLGITDITEKLRGVEHGILNADNSQINVIRRYEDRGIRLMGARTISSDPNERYVNVRRYVIFLTVSLERGLQSLIFEPNNRRLWARTTVSLTNFLQTQYRSGALLGATAEEAFFVRCDETTMTEDDLLNGRLIAQVGVAITRPAEFVIIQLQKDGLTLAG